MSDQDIDSLEDDLAELEREEEADDWRRFLRFAPMILAAGAFVIFSVIVLIAYSGDEDDEKPAQVAAPVLTPQTAIKIEPEDPGGMEIPDQDKLVYNQLNQGADDGQVEQILPGAEDAKEPPKVATETAKPTLDAVKPPTDVASVPLPSDPDVAVLAEPQTPAPEAPVDAVKMPDKPADAAIVPGKPGDAVAAAPLVIPDQPQIPAPEGTTPTAQTPILNGPEAPATAKPVVTKPKPVTTTQMRTLSGVYRIQIASLKTPVLAEREWSDQVKKNPDLLSKLSLTVQRAVVKNAGTYYRVQAGPLQDRESADRLCSNLRSRGQDCIVVRP